MAQSKDVIIGAGLSGLSCGWVLRDSMILEGEGFIGGLARTLEYNEFLSDLGGHRFFADNPSTEYFIRTLLKNEIIETDRKSKIYKDGRLIDYPLRVSAAFQINPLETALSLSACLYRKIRPVKEDSFEGRAINLFGDRLYKSFFREYTRRVWGITCDRISNELADARLGRVSLASAVKNAFLKDANIKSFAEKIIYPKKGIAGIAKALSRGLDIRLGSRVTGLVYSDTRIERLIVNDSEEVPCKNVISTMPVTELMRFFNPPDVVKKASQNLKYRSLICVFFILNKKRHTENHWIYLHDANTAGRLHEPKNWSPYMAEKERTGICVEVFCDRKDGIWGMKDEEIASRIMGEVPFVKKTEIADCFVTRTGHAYPVYDIHYPRNLKMARDCLGSYKNLFLLGRTGSFKYMNMDGCIEDGLKLGRSLDTRSIHR